jgi:hypothetical protein
MLPSDADSPIGTEQIALDGETVILRAVGWRPRDAARPVAPPAGRSTIGTLDGRGMYPGAVAPCGWS